MYILKEHIIWNLKILQNGQMEVYDLRPLSIINWMALTGFWSASEMVLECFSVGNNCQVYVYHWVGCGWGTFSVLLRLVFISHPHNEYNLFSFQTWWDEKYQAG